MNKLIQKINPIDWAFIVYQCAVAVLLVIFHQNFPPWLGYTIVHVFAIAGALIIIHVGHESENTILRLMRYWYPVITYGFLFEESGVLNQMVFQGYWDLHFANMDLKLFGVHPNEWLYDKIDNFWVNEFFHLCYFLYYVIPVLLGILLYKDRDHRFFRILFGITLTFYLCYYVYIFTPVRGPLELRHGRFMDGGLFVQIMDWIYIHAEKPGAAFPSSHVAIALITLFYTFRYRRNLFWWFLPFISGLVFSTVYAFYHYVVDAIAGAALSVAMFYLCEWAYEKGLYRRFQEKL